MIQNILGMAFQATLRKKRSSILVFSVLLLSFSCAIVSLSLTESISKTNEEYRLNTFGEWYIALPYTKNGDRAWVEQQDWAKEVASETVYSSMYPGVLPGSFGTITDSYYEAGRLEMIEGRLPESDNEVAVTETVLEALVAYCEESFSVGDEIPIPCYVDNVSEQSDTGIGEGVGVIVGLQYTLCGVIKDYSDPWELKYNRYQDEPVNVIMTENGAQALLDKANAAMQKLSPVNTHFAPMEQLFICVDQSARLDAVAEMNGYMASTRNVEEEDIYPCVNYAAYPKDKEVGESNTLYAVLIAVVALMAVFCVYIMNLPAEVHSFAVLRSVGITKGQLLLLMLFESLLLAVPSVLLGVPLGAGLTWLALRLLVYSGSVAIQVVIPYGMLKTLFALWLLVILLARLVIFLITVHTPLTGRMQMQERKARRTAHLRRVLVVLLLAVFGICVLYTAGESLWPRFTRLRYASSADYTVTNVASASAALRESIEEIEGIEAVEGFMKLSSTSNDSSQVKISFDGIGERWTNLYMVDARGWSDTIDFGDDLEAFENGDIIYLMMSSSYVTLTENGRQVTGEHYEWPDAPLPEGDVTVYAVNGSGEKYYAEVSAAAKILRKSERTNNRNMSFGATEPYTIVCSETFVRKLVEQLPEGIIWGSGIGSLKWGGFAANKEFGYQTLLISADENAADLSAIYAVQSLVRKEFGNDSPLADQSEEKQAGMQAATQELILLYACGGCIAIVSLLLLASALALEAEQERRSFTILRVIGMSKRQMRRRIAGKALRRSVFAIVAGWALYAALRIRTQLVLNKLAFVEAAKNAWSGFAYSGGSTALIFILSAAMLAVLLAVSLLAKRGLKQTTLLK